METKNTIRHKGRVVEVMNGAVKVSVVATSACSACSIKEHCLSTERKEKEIVAKTLPNDNFTVGDVVDVEIAQGLGLKAVGIAYGIPCIVLIVSMVLASRYFTNDFLVAGIALAATAATYGIIYLLRGKIERNFSITATKEA